MNTISRVDELLEHRNITLFKLSEICNIPYVTLQNAKRRKSQLSVDTIEKVCKGLNITMSDFFAERGEKK